MQALLAGGYRYEEGMPYRAEGVAVEAHAGKADWGGGHRDLIRRDMKKSWGWGHKKFLSSGMLRYVLECFGSFSEMFR